MTKLSYKVVVFVETCVCLALAWIPINTIGVDVYTVSLSLTALVLSVTNVVVSLFRKPKAEVMPEACPYKIESPDTYHLEKSWSLPQEELTEWSSYATRQKR